MKITEQIALAAMFYFGQVFVFWKLISKIMLEWFLLIMCKEHTRSRSRNFLSRNHPKLSFWLRREGQQFPKTDDVCTFSTCGCCICLVFWFRFRIQTKENRNGLVSIKVNLVFLLAVCVNSVEHSFTYKYMPYLWSLIWLSHVFGSWYLIIWLGITAQNPAVNIWTVAFSNWLIFWNFVSGKSLSKLKTNMTQ